MNTAIIIVDTKELKSLFGKWDKHLIVNDEQTHYALVEMYDDFNTVDKALAFICVRDFGSYYKIQGIFTPEENRKKGYFTKLGEFVLSKYSDKPIKVDCLPPSLQFFLNNGFKETQVKNFKHYQIHRVERIVMKKDGE